MAGHTPDSLSVDWCTPDKWVNLVREVFNGIVDLDPCSNKYSTVNAKTEYTLNNGKDGLIEPWVGKNVFVNPPFGKAWYEEGDGIRTYLWPNERQAMKERYITSHGQLEGVKLFNHETKALTKVDIGHWVNMCAHHGVDNNVIGLIPAYTDTQYFQKWVWGRANMIAFPKGRIHFKLVHTLKDGNIRVVNGPAPMATCFPLWSKDEVTQGRFYSVFHKLGYVVV